MKKLARRIVASILALLARGILAKYRPIVVMVTGSVGKTSTKDAVAAALSEKYHLRASEKSYNSEFGVPLTIIGSKNPWTSPIAWLRVIGEALALILLPNHYPRLLVLEVGADSPGDLWQILNMVTPSAVVVTRLPEIPVHVEAYASAEAVREEEFAPAYALPEDAPLIISAEDHHAIRLASQLSVKLVAFGTSDDADVRIKDVKHCMKAGIPCGMEAKVLVGKEEHTIRANNALGRSQIYAPAAALALALSLGLSARQALKGLAKYEPPAGRARILLGIHDSIIIDDSYNASPAAVEEVLRSLPELPGKRRVAVLGDMLELGRYSKDEHERIGTLAAEHADIVVAVGTRASAIADAAERARKGEVLRFDTSKEAAKTLPELIQEGDIVLVKGSQGIRTERIVEALLRNPEDMPKLVRQEREWKKR